MASQHGDQEQAKPVAPRADSSGDSDTSVGHDMSATLLKRVAEAAAGFRDGRRVWFVAERAFPHSLEEFHDEADADAALARRPDSHVKVGPCLTPDDHARRKRIEWIKVKIEGRQDPVEFNPDKVDALFFSQSALDKFLYPYYTALYGPDEAAKIYKSYEAAALVCHRPLSVPCMDEDGGSS